jgi:hypothetical protein
VVVGRKEPGFVRIAEGARIHLALSRMSISQDTADRSVA